MKTILTACAVLFACTLHAQTIDLSADYLLPVLNGGQFSGGWGGGIQLRGPQHPITYIFRMDYGHGSWNKPPAPYGASGDITFMPLLGGVALAFSDAHPVRFSVEFLAGAAWLKSNGGIGAYAPNGHAGPQFDEHFSVVRSAAGLGGTIVDNTSEFVEISASAHLMTMFYATDAEGVYNADASHPTTTFLCFGLGLSHRF